MSLPNPNKPVTEQRLHEFYDRIKPYMGIYPPMVANKFSKGDLYSTSEKMIGQWYDGKPLYQRTITGINTPSSKNTDVVIYTFDSDVDMVHSVEGYLIDTGVSSKVMIPINLAYIMDGTSDSNVFISVFVDDSSGRRKLKCRCCSWNDFPLVLTVKYTKTTDSAVSIGDETDYSTTEKIVGTWIDSKPIYQKTYVLNNEEGFANNAWTYLSITEMTPIENIISLSAFQSNGTNVSFDIWYDASSHKFSVKSLRTENEYVKVFTIQYTKSS